MSAPSTCDLCGEREATHACVECFCWVCPEDTAVPDPSDPTCVNCADELGYHQPSPPAERQVVDVDPGGRL